MLLGGEVSEGSVWWGEVRRTETDVGGAGVVVSGVLSVLSLPSAACGPDVSWWPRAVVLVLVLVMRSCPTCSGTLGGSSRVRTYPAKRRLKFFPTAGAHSTDQHSY